MKVYAWLIDFARFRENCPTGIIPEWMRKVTQHNGIIQYYFSSYCKIWWIGHIEILIFNFRLARRSKEEYDELQKRIRDEEEAIERALRESERIFELLNSQTKVSVQDLKALVQQMEALSTVTEEEEKAEPQNSDVTDVSVSDRPPPIVTITDALDAQENQHGFISVKQFISPEELKRRQDYLRSQRDKLLSKKEALRLAEEANSVNTFFGY